MPNTHTLPDLASAQQVEIRLSGFGGQGILLAGYILGQAATVFSNRNVMMAQSYGPESRGGASQVELIISDEEIGYPRVESPDVVVTLSQQAYVTYGLTRPSGCLLVADSDLVSLDDTVESTRSAVLVPLTRWAEERLGRRITANIVTLGFLCGLTAVVAADALEKAVVSSAPRGSADLNRQALAMGLDEAIAYRNEAGSMAP